MNALPRIVIVDYGMGNVGSVKNAADRLGLDTTISQSHCDLKGAGGFILPGVGAFGQAMANLRKAGIIDLLRAEVLTRRRPLLGICLGMQVLFEDSDEMGSFEGLGILPGRVRRMVSSSNERIPHVGWNSIAVKQPSPLFGHNPGDANYYFDHSFVVHCSDEIVTATCDYGGGFPAAIRCDNVFATQFHPEKSHIAGLRVLRGFANYCAEVSRC